MRYTHIWLWWLALYFVAVSNRHQQLTNRYPVIHEAVSSTKKVLALISINLFATWYVVPTLGARHLDMHNTEHFAIYGPDAPGYNKEVLKGVDAVQQTAMDGGGYFIGVTAVPAESPVGFPLALFSKALLDPPRKTSYCSGASYAAMIEALNLICADDSEHLTEDRYEAMRMQEPDGGRRNDFVKVWGAWNADGPGSEYALVQYTKMGERIAPEQARPGDFMNISWKNGIGHSVVFLGWCIDERGRKCVLYWSSQTGTNGFGDQMSPLSRVAKVLDVRLTHPQNLFTFDPNQQVSHDATWDSVDWGY